MELVKRLRDYGLCLDPCVVIHDRRVVDEAADTLTEALQVVREAREALEPFVSGAGHTMVFLRSREKMHPAGQDLYLDDVKRARTAEATLTAFLAQHEGEAP